VSVARTYLISVFIFFPYLGFRTFRGRGRKGRRERPSRERGGRRERRRGGIRAIAASGHQSMLLSNFSRTRRRPLAGKERAYQKMREKRAMSGPSFLIVHLFYSASQKAFARSREGEGKGGRGKEVYRGRKKKEKKGQGKKGKNRWHGL